MVIYFCCILFCPKGKSKGKITESNKVFAQIWQTKEPFLEMVESATMNSFSEVVLIIKRILPKCFLSKLPTNSRCLEYYNTVFSCVDV